MTATTTRRNPQRSKPTCTAIIASLMFAGASVWIGLQLRQDARQGGYHGPNPILVDVLLEDPDRFDNQQVAVLCYLYVGEGAAILPKPPADVQANSTVRSPRGVLARLSEDSRTVLRKEYGRGLDELGEVVVIIRGQYHRAGYQEDPYLLSSAPFVAVDHIGIPFVRAR